MTSRTVWNFVSKKKMFTQTLDMSLSATASVCKISGTDNDQNPHMSNKYD